MNSLAVWISSFNIWNGHWTDLRKVHFSFRCVFKKNTPERLQISFIWHWSRWSMITRVCMVDRSTQQIQVFGCSDFVIELSLERTDFHFHTNWEFVSTWEELTNWLPRKQTRYSTTSEACYHTVDVNGCCSLQIWVDTSPFNWSIWNAWIWWL